MSLFEQTTSEQQPTDTTPADNQATLLASIRNENGDQKYSSIEEAMKALQHSQNYIKDLKRERDEYAKKATDASNSASKVDELERIVKEFSTRKQEQTTPQVDVDALERLIDNRYATVRSQEAIALNQKNVSDSLIGKFGEKAGEIMQTKATELGMSLDDIAALAGRSPKAVLTMFGVSGTDAPKQSTQAPSPSGINTAGLADQRKSLLGDRQSFLLRPGHSGRDVQDLVDRSSALTKELQEKDGVSVHDLTNPSTYFKYFG